LSKNQKQEYMKSLSITISDNEFERFGLKKETLSFSEFIEIIKNEISKQSLSTVAEIAEKYGLSKMTMDEIDVEIQAVRDAKNYH